MFVRYYVAVVFFPKMNTKDCKHAVNDFIADIKNMRLKGGKFVFQQEVYLLEVKMAGLVTVAIHENRGSRLKNKLFLLFRYIFTL
jgi:hypothetical protein